MPTTLSPDGRSRPPHLRSWRDGWRHLRFLLLFSPRWLFLYPGVAALVAGLAVMACLLPGPKSLFGATFDIHTLLYASLAVSVGYQSVLFWVFAKVYGMREGIVPPDPWFRGIIDVATLERGLIAALVLLIMGIGIGVRAVSAWDAVGYGGLSPSSMMRLVIPSALAILLAFQTGYGTFFLSVLEIRATRAPPGE